MLIVEPAYGNTTIRLCWSDDDYSHGADPSGAWMRIKHAHMPEKLPDLNDPATLGCLLALVRDAGWPLLLRCFRGRWQYYVGPGYVYGADALVAALEAAP